MTLSWPPTPAPRMWRAPSGYVCIPHWAMRNAEQAYEQWSRTREERIHGLMQCGTAETLSDAQPWQHLGEALAAMADHLAAEDSRDVPIWEMEFSGQIRRGSFRPERQPPVSTTDVKLDSEPDRLAGGQDRRLRRCALDEIALDENILVNQVASYLGHPVTNAVGWTTVAPVTGSTPNWNQTEVRTLSWSGHATSYLRSRTAALVEGIERRVGALQTAGVTTLACGKDLPGRVITPEDFPPYPEDFYRYRGVHYSESEIHEWVRGRSLVTDEPVWFPREYIFYGEQMAHHRWALSTSSGCATGSSTAEAALFGLLELLERDAFLASWHGQIPARRVDPESLPGMGPVLARARLLGYEIETGFLPSPTGIPAAVAVASSPEIRALGSACHPDPVRALSQAVEEAWTYLPERVEAVRDRASQVAAVVADSNQVTDIEDHPLVFIPGQDPSYDEICGTGRAVHWEQAVTEMGDFSAFQSARGLLEHLVGVLERDGVETFVHIQTSEVERSLGFDTVMVLSPDLLPIDFGWGNQRALSSSRLAELTQRFTGMSQAPRLLPHPFS
ncbi:MAG: YcaO-like family protein [Brevibacterium sp.]|nr:YcaO-like family protein [Brevibacterium sp.]MDN6528166.1 YcaO-like family protein [Brevibacterium sp.]